MAGEVRMRTLFIAAERCPASFQQCCVLAVTPLLRELILRAVQGPQQAQNPLIQQLMLEEIASLENLPLHVPMPQDRRLQAICLALLRTPTTPTPWKIGRSRWAPAHGPWRDCSSSRCR